MAIATSTALAIGAIAITAAGTGVAVAGMQQQAKAAERSEKFNEAIAKNNATMAQYESKFQADRIRKRNRIILSKQKASFAKSGVVLDGTPEDFIYDSELEGELDALAALYTGQVRSTTATSEAQQARARGRAIASALPYNTASTILTGTGQIAGLSGGLVGRGSGGGGSNGMLLDAGRGFNGSQNAGQV